MSRLAALLGVVALAAGCRTARPLQPVSPSIASAPPLSEPPPETISWSATRPLRWTDFQAQPAVGTGAAALTTTTISLRVACYGDLFGFDVTAVFLPGRSWVDRTQFVEPGSDLWGLHHEQTHFDLTEMHARRARQFLSSLARPCDRTPSQLSELGERFVNEAQDAQDRYDRETIHGRDGTAQRRWDAEVAQELAALAAFERR